MPNLIPHEWLVAVLLSTLLACPNAAQAQAHAVELLHSFSGWDGANPIGPLLPAGGEFWGTTKAGGQFGWGSIFRISRTGTLTTVYSFLGLGDGASPERLALGPDGAIYGTTHGVLASGTQPPIPGTLFRIAPSGALLTLFVFRRFESGYQPGGLTVTRDGSIYGWTSGGGAGGMGTVFRASTDGSISTLYDFSSNDSVVPLTGDLVEGADGNLWGKGGGPWSGTVFSLTPSGTLTVVHEFHPSTVLSLIAGVDGQLYGTYTHLNPHQIERMLFSLTTSGAMTEHVLFFPYSFDVECLTQTTDGTLMVNLGGLLARVRADGMPVYVARLPGYVAAGFSSATLIDGRDGYLYGATFGGSGGGSSLGAVFRVSLTVVPAHPFGDFDGDGQSDLTVYRPPGPFSGSFSTRGSSGSQMGAVLGGDAGQVPVPADYEGPAFTDYAVYSSGRWDLRLFDGRPRTIQWGMPGDLPVPGDYDGDGQADLAVYRPSTGQWLVLKSSTNLTSWDSVQWGLATDIPVPADYDGDGKIDRAVYRPTTGTWYILQSRSNNTRWAAYLWGEPGDVPVPGDYDGDGLTDLAVYRPSTGTWLVALSTMHFGHWLVRNWGLSGDMAAPADYDGDGVTDIAVYRPTTSEWLILTSRSGFTAWVTYQWGNPGDIPVTMVPQPKNPPQ